MTTNQKTFSVWIDHYVDSWMGRRSFTAFSLNSRWYFTGSWEPAAFIKRPILACTVHLLSDCFTARSDLFSTTLNTVVPAHSDREKEDFSSLSHSLWQNLLILISHLSEYHFQYERFKKACMWMFVYILFSPTEWYLVMNCLLKPSHTYILIPVRCVSMLCGLHQHKYA